MTDPRSPRTLELYARIMSELRTAFGVVGDSVDFLQDTTAVSSWIEGKPKALATKKLYYATAKTVLRDIGNSNFREAEAFYGAKMAQYNEGLQRIAEEQEMTEREEELWVNWPDVIALREKLGANITDMSSFQDYVILCLYTYLPPVRLDYSPVRVVNDAMEAPEGNVLVCTDREMHFIIREYKTVRKLGEQRIAVPKPLREILGRWFDINGSGWLLLTVNGTALTEVGLGQRIRYIFKTHTGRGSGVNILRHSFITHVRRGEKSLKKQQKLAAAMGHSTAMNVLYRRLKN